MSWWVDRQAKILKDAEESIGFFDERCICGATLEHHYMGALIVCPTGFTLKCDRCHRAALSASRLCAECKEVTV